MEHIIDKLMLIDTTCWHAVNVYIYLFYNITLSDTILIT